MQLNSILFPAPKCSYTVEQLQGELIWIPKFKKMPTVMNRISTAPMETKTRTLTSTNIHTETRKNILPQAALKKSMPRSQTNQNSVINHASFKSTLIDDMGIKPLKQELGSFDPQNYKLPETKTAFTVASDSESPNISVLEQSEVMDEGDIPIKTAKGNKVKESKTAKMNESAEVTISLDDIPTAKEVCASTKGKRFFGKGSKGSSKNSKASTNENSLFSHQENNLLTTQEYPPIAHEKKPSLKILQTMVFNGMSPFESKPTHKRQPSAKIIKTNNMPPPSISREESKLNFEAELYEEYPSSSTQLSSPKNLFQYETKIFTNPNTTNPVSSPGSSTLKQINSARLGKNPLFAQSVTTTPNKMSLLHFNKSVLNTPMPKPKEQLDYHIPCLLLKAAIPTNNLMLYFHGNGEDVYLAYDLLSHIRNNLCVFLRINVLAIEYPGYGLYKGAPSDEQILSDADAVFEYLTSRINVHPKNIVVFGRSMGSGPASFLASKKNIGSLVLMSAFTSIRAVVRDLAGKWAQFLIKERFNNLENMSRVTCPTFLIHGLKDNLIPYKQSQELHNACKGPCELVLPKEMDHIEFDFYEDFTAPLAYFLARCNFQLRPKKGAKIDFPPTLFEAPFGLNRSQTIHTQQSQQSVTTFQSPRSNMSKKLSFGPQKKESNQILLF